MVDMLFPVVFYQYPDSLLLLVVGVNALYCPLSISLPQHIRLLREKQAAFLEANGSELFYFSTDPVSKLNDYLSFPQDIRSPRSPEDETPSTPLAPASSPFLPHDSNTTPNAVGSNLNITEAMNCSILTEKPPMSSLAGSGRVIPELKPPLSNSLSKDLNRALASSLDCLGAKPVRPPFEIRHHSSPNTVTNGCSQTKTSESHPIKYGQNNRSYVYSCIVCSQCGGSHSPKCPANSLFKPSKRPIGMHPTTRTDVHCILNTAKSHTSLSCIIEPGCCDGFGTPTFHHPTVGRVPRQPNKTSKLPFPIFPPQSSAFDHRFRK